MQKREMLSRMTSRVRAWVLEQLQREDWGHPLKHGTTFAKMEIRRRRWRGKRSGVLPEGYDANSVASEAVSAMLQCNCCVALGWTRQRLEAELERLIRNEVRRLHRLTEASRVRSEWDILAPQEDGTPRSIFAWIPGSIPDPFEEAARQEEEEARARLELGIRIYLNGDKGARGVFACLCDGTLKRRDIAERLGMSVGAVTSARKRLERKVKEYRFRCALMGNGHHGAEPRRKGIAHGGRGPGKSVRKVGLGFRRRMDMAA